MCVRAADPTQHSNLHTDTQAFFLLPQPPSHDPTTTKTTTSNPTTTKTPTSLPPEIEAELFARVASFFGEEAFAQHIRPAFVIVVGLGGVGSHAAHMLVRIERRRKEERV